MTDWVTLRVPAVPHVVGIARAMTVTSATSAGMSQERVDDVRTCTSEAVTNALQAHRRAEVTLPIVIRTTVSDGLFIVEVGDCGKGIPDEGRDADSMPTTDMEVDQLAEGGFGIPVMKELSDGFEVVAGGLLNPSTGTTVRLTFQTQESKSINV